MRSRTSSRHDAACIYNLQFACMHAHAALQGGLEWDEDEEAEHEHEGGALLLSELLRRRTRKADSSSNSGASSSGSSSSSSDGEGRGPASQAADAHARRRTQRSRGRLGPPRRKSSQSGVLGEAPAPPEGAQMGNSSTGAGTSAVLSRLNSRGHESAASHGSKRARVHPGIQLRNLRVVYAAPELFGHLQHKRHLARLRPLQFTSIIIMANESWALNPLNTNYGAACVCPGRHAYMHMCMPASFAGWTGA